MRKDDFVGVSFGVVIAATLFLIVFMLGSQVVGWLEHGAWPGLPISKILAAIGIERPVVAWKGAQQLIDIALSLHAGIGVFVVGLSLAMLVGWLFDLIATAFIRLASPLPPKRRDG